MNIYIEQSSIEYEKLFASFGFKSVFAPEAADIVCFTGGSDVSPFLYGDKQHHTTYNNPERDRKEQALFGMLLDKKVPMVGICRGAQFLNVMSGGRMYQDVREHCRSHPITDLETGEVHYVTSTHHQMMLPEGQFILVASSMLHGKREWYEGEVAKRDISDQDIEVVYYENTKCLCFQPHPEMYQGLSTYDGMRTYFRSLLTRYLGA